MPNDWGGAVACREDGLFGAGAERLVEAGEIL